MIRRLISSTALLSTLALAGCWGAVSIGGTLSGLPSGSSVTLQNNGTDSLTLTQDGAFEFRNLLDDGDSYAVTVSVQPTGANCAVANGTGSITASSRDVTNVQVTCTSTASISGTVSGLLAGSAVTLVNDGAGGGSVVVGTNGAFSIGSLRPNGEGYSVRVSQNPINMSCTVTGGSGNVVTGTTTNIEVSCVSL